jgi:hypothetical protein
MKPKQFGLAATMGILIATGLWTNSFAAKDAVCLSKCGLTYVQELNKCPSPNIGDGMPNIQCGENAKSTQHACVDACPNEGTSTNTKTDTTTK